MGAGQSSAAGGSQPAAEVKTSYYELLGVTRQATDEEIKKAYRRKALELHPDRNYGDVERTTALFAEVQLAYEVLSDPHERAWYDSHETTILRGGDVGDVGEEHYEHNVRVTSAAELTALLAKFNSRIDFTDSPTGFFGYLRDIFAQLAKEEEVAADWEGLDIVNYPPFGHKDDEYNDVVKTFYAVWAGFSTKKTFAWMDMYRLNEAPDRRVRRLMEKENQKRRDQGIREFNDAVRVLVAFVRKRDPRYTPSTLSEADRQKALRDAAAAQAARSRAANEAKFNDVVPEWTKTRESEEMVESEESEEIEEEHFECVACHKIFKSERQFDAHEKSKKHQKAIQALRRQMQKENANLDLDDHTHEDAITPISDAEESPTHADEEIEVIEEKAERKQTEGQESEEDNDLENEENDVKQTNENGRVTSESVNETQNNTLDVDSEDSDYAPPERVSARLAGLTVDEETSEPASLTSNSVPIGQTGQKMGKAAQKRAKKAAQAAAASQEELKFKCAVCDAVFPSKTRMFQHIKDFGHAAIKSETKPGKGKGKGKK